MLRYMTPGPVEFSCGSFSFVPEKSASDGGGMVEGGRDYESDENKRFCSSGHIRNALRRLMVPEHVLYLQVLVFDQTLPLHLQVILPAPGNLSLEHCRAEPIQSSEYDPSPRL